MFHSDDARKQLKDFTVGSLQGYTGPADAVLRGRKGASSSTTGTATSEGVGSSAYLLAFAAAAALIYVFVL